VQARNCERLAEATGDPVGRATADWAAGQVRYYLGEHAAAADHLQRARASYPIAMRSDDPLRFGGDLLACSLGYQAVTSWSLGYAERAFRAGRDAIKEARSVNNPISLCVVLAAPSSILLVKMGYLEEAERCIEELIEHSDRHALTPYNAFGLCSKGGLMAIRGDVTEAERLLRVGLQRSREVRYYLFDAFFQGELAAVLGTAGRIDEALVEIDAALGYAEKSESLWCLPEILRVKGELLASRAGAEANAAEQWFIQSLDLANRQQALSWALRAATSLARFWRDRDRAAEAHEVLDQVYRRFTEGFDTADLQSANDLLRQLSPRAA
jgi:non-specific serine/threonine protein kinase